jgi:hypothetical protein
MSNRCRAFDPNVDGVLQRCVLQEGHSGPHKDEVGLEFFDDEAEY